MIRGVNLDDAVKPEGIEASTIDGSYGGLTGGASLSQIVRESRNYLIKNTSYTALAGEQIGVNTTAGPNNNSNRYTQRQVKLLQLLTPQSWSSKRMYCC